MKIKVKEKSFSKVSALPPYERKKPMRQRLFWRTLLRIVSAPDLRATHFHCERIGMERLGKREPALFLMNHSSFIDLKIASTILFPRPFNIVCTTDGFVGKHFLMRSLGCIPTNKFVTDLHLVRDMRYCLRELKQSVLMFPEAGYSLDGTATRLPASLAKCAKMMGVPVVMIRAEGAYARQPLYNQLHRRAVDVSASMEYLFSPEDLKEKSVEEIDEVLHKAFGFDNFRWQQEKHIRIDEPDRADYLNRLLYKCPACHQEGQTHGEGTELTCRACGKTWELDEYGYLRAKEGETEFAHLPDWFNWERECVRTELMEDRYFLDTDVDIYVFSDGKCMYHIGDGHLTHGKEGFHLTDARGELDYTHRPGAAYSLNADYNWYELGDVISFGTNAITYYCLPKGSGDVVTKARLATEELWTLLQKEKSAIHK